MAARKRRSRAHRPRTPEPGAAFADSAQRIWLAGLGAYERAREEGPKMFDVLVEQGRGLGGKAREAADQALRGLRDGSTVERLQKLGRGDVSELTRQVRELGETLSRLATPPASGSGRKRRATRKKAPTAGARRRSRPSPRGSRSAAAPRAPRSARGGARPASRRKSR
jgi:poly(hydroxyalkanoate) granule-associated protein